MKTGVIVARFQVPELHVGHASFLRQAIEQSDRLVICLGVSPLDARDPRTPLTFSQRQGMLLAHLHEAGHITPLIFPLMDHPSHEEWSTRLDDLLSSTFRGLDDEVTLFCGAHESFERYYTGKHTVSRLLNDDPALDDLSGTRLREGITEVFSHDFLRGQTYALQQQYHTVFPTVDVALTSSNHQVFLVQRKDTGLWVFPGGFVDPSDLSFERAAQRELFEETGLVSEASMQYIGSVRVDDWRYRWSSNKITTVFYRGFWAFGTPQLQEAEVADGRWVSIDSPDVTVADMHLPLMTMLRRHLQKEEAR